MVGKDALKSALRFVMQAIVSILPRHSIARTHDGERLLSALVDGNPPATLRSAHVTVKFQTVMVRSRFVCDADMDACEKWLTAKIQAWMKVTGRTGSIEVRQSPFEPVISARLLELPHQDDLRRREKASAGDDPSSPFPTTA